MIAMPTNGTKPSRLEANTYSINSIQGPKQCIALAYRKQYGKCEKLQRRRLNAFGNSQIFLKGTVTLKSSGHTGESCTSKYYVTDQADAPILGHKACNQLKD